MQVVMPPHLPHLTDWPIEGSHVLPLRVFFLSFDDRPWLPAQQTPPAKAAEPLLPRGCHQHHLAPPPMGPAAKLQRILRVGIARPKAFSTLKEKIVGSAAESLLAAVLTFPGAK